LGASPLGAQSPARRAVGHKGRGADDRMAPAQLVRFVPADGHAQLEVSACGRWARSRLEPDDLVDLRDAARRGGWVRLRLDPPPSRRARLVRAYAIVPSCAEELRGGGASDDEGDDEGAEGDEGDEGAEGAEGGDGEHDGHRPSDDWTRRSAPCAPGSMAETAASAALRRVCCALRVFFFVLLLMVVAEVSVGSGCLRHPSWPAYASAPGQGWPGWLAGRAACAASQLASLPGSLSQTLRLTLSAIRGEPAGEPSPWACDL